MYRILSNARAMRALSSLNHYLNLTVEKPNIHTKPEGSDLGNAQERN